MDKIQIRHSVEIQKWPQNVFSFKTMDLVGTQASLLRIKPSLDIQIWHSMEFQFLKIQIRYWVEIQNKPIDVFKFQDSGLSRPKTSRLRIKLSFEIQIRHSVDIQNGPSQSYFIDLSTVLVWHYRFRFNIP